MYRHTWALGNLARQASVRQLGPAVKQPTLLYQVPSWRAGTHTQSSVLVNNASYNGDDLVINERRIGNSNSGNNNTTLGAGQSQLQRTVALQPVRFGSLPPLVPYRHMTGMITVDQSGMDVLSTQLPNINDDARADNQQAFNDRILSLKHEGNLQAVLREFALMKNLGVARSLLTYNLVLDALVDLRQRDTSMRPMMDVFHELDTETNLHPSLYTYRVVIRGLCAREMEVCRLRAQIETRLQQTNDMVDQTRLAELTAEKNLEMAMQLFERACTTFSKPMDINILDSLLLAAAERGDVDASLKVVEAMELMPGVKPTSQTYGALIKSFGRSNDLEAAREYFQIFMEKWKQGTITNVNVRHEIAPFNGMVMALVCCGDLEGAQRFVDEDMPKAGVTPDSTTYNSLTAGYIQAGNLEAAERYFDQLGQMPSVLAANATSLQMILSMACKQDNPTLAHRVYQLHLDYNHTVRYGNLMDYLELCLRHGDAENAINVMTMLERNRYNPDAQFRQSILGLVQHPSITLDNKLALVSRLISSGLAYPDRANLLRDLVICLVQVHPEAYEAHLKMMRELHQRGTKLNTQITESFMHSYQATRKRIGVVEIGKLTDVHDYTLIMSFWLDRARSVEPIDKVFDRIFELLNDMKVCQKTPPHSFCSSLSHRVQRIGGSEAQERWHKSLKEIFGDKIILDSPANIPSSQKVSAVVGSAVTSPNCAQPITTERTALKPLPTSNVGFDFWRTSSEICLMSRQPKRLNEAAQKYREMMATGAIPPPETARVLMFGFSAAGRMEECRQLTEATLARYDTVNAPRERFSMRQVILNNLLISCAKNGDAAGARNAYERLRADGQFPGKTSYSELLRLYSGHDDLKEGLRLYNEMPTAPSAYFANILLGKMAKQRGLHDTVKLFDQMRIRGTQPSSITFGILINAAFKAGEEERAIYFYNEMCRRPEHENNPGPFHTMMQHALSRGDRGAVLQYLSAMRRRMVVPQAHTYRLLIEAYAFVAPQDLKLAEQTLRDMLQTGLKPAGAHFAPLLSGHAAEGRSDRVERLWNELSRYPHLPDETAYLAGIAAAETCCQHKWAQLLRDEMFTSGKMKSTKQNR